MSKPGKHRRPPRYSLAPSGPGKHRKASGYSLTRSDHGKHRRSTPAPPSGPPRHRKPSRFPGPIVLSAIALAFLSTSASGTTPTFPPPERALAPAAAQDPVIPAVSVFEGARFGRPVDLVVPALGIDTSLIDLGLNPDHTLQVPSNYQQAGWYIHSSVPGKVGPAIVAGHVSSEVGPGIFYALHLLVPGDEVVIRGKGGTVARFVIERVERFPKAEFPTKLVYGKLKYPGLRLITCGGAFNADTGHFLDNVVVFARLAFQRPSEGAVNSETSRTFIDGVERL